MPYLDVVSPIISVLGFIGSYIMIFMNRSEKYSSGLADHFKAIETTLAAHILSDATVQATISSKLDMVIQELNKELNKQSRS